MPVYLYQILHIVGLLMIFLGYGALLALGWTGREDARLKKLGSITSGIGLVLVLVAGFALITKLGYSFTAPWLIVKMLVWLALGGLIAVINRKPALAGTLWWLLLGLGALAVVMVYYVRLL